MHMIGKRLADKVFPPDEEIDRITKELLRLNPEGNARELRGLIFRWFVSPVRWEKYQTQRLKIVEEKSVDNSKDLRSKEECQELERQLVFSVVQKCDGNIHVASAKLGIDYEETRKILKELDPAPKKVSLAPEEIKQREDLKKTLFESMTSGYLSSDLNCDGIRKILDEDKVTMILEKIRAEIKIPKDGKRSNKRNIPDDERLIERVLCVY